ncbi:hypothetical protein [Runella sp.]|uniref:hypothetical protein n=1 Tax=Runella sp. TaxID=1960881 RepID=UPI0026253415|nr:hypothetical protein [Runella sp.]
MTLTNNNNGTATITPTGTGTATLTYQVTDANGCQSPLVNYSIGINAALPSATVSAGAPVGFTSLLGVRYRAFNRPAEKELYLGIPDLGIPPHAVLKLTLPGRQATMMLPTNMIPLLTS